MTPVTAPAAVEVSKALKPDALGAGVTRMSTLTLAVATGFVVLAEGNSVPEAIMRAVLVRVAGAEAMTLAVSVKVALAPLARLERLHSPVAEL
jgi:hypothetical protein